MTFSTFVLCLALLLVVMTFPFLVRTLQIVHVILEIDREQRNR